MDHTLYQQAMLTHYQNPCGFEQAIRADRQESGYNPACGDEITIELQFAGGNGKGADKVIAASAFTGHSCAICRASASILCQQLTSIDLKAATSLVTSVFNAITDNSELTGDIAPLNAVFNFPIRKQCALLPWQVAVKCLTKTESQLSQSQKSESQ
ncbi:iron-sulfur cluster assembly scaffold protein [Colwellia sp. MEBiC06753]